LGQLARDDGSLGAGVDEEMIGTAGADPDCDGHPVIGVIGNAKVVRLIRRRPR
jgi:hypothetical protein